MLKMKTERQLLKWYSIMKNKKEFLKKYNSILFMIVLVITITPIINYFLDVSIKRLSIHYEKKEKVINYLKEYENEKLKKKNIIEQLPDYNESLKFLNFIIESGKKSNIKIFSIKSKKKKENGSIKKLYMEIPVEGKYDKIKNFIYEIEKSFMAIYIESIENNPISNSKARLSLTISLVLMYRGDK